MYLKKLQSIRAATDNPQRINTAMDGGGTMQTRDLCKANRAGKKCTRMYVGKKCTWMYNCSTGYFKRSTEKHSSFFLKSFGSRNGKKFSLYRTYKKWYCLSAYSMAAVGFNILCYSTKYRDIRLSAQIKCC